jgi:hypothetical protein
MAAERRFAQITLSVFVTRCRQAYGVPAAWVCQLDHRIGSASDLSAPPPCPTASVAQVHYIDSTLPPVLILYDGRFCQQQNRIWFYGLDNKTLQRHR